MSLKAKIEAVIYASEEPVTLVQLVGLLGVEAQAELDELESQQQSLALTDVDPQAASDADDQDALNAETLDRSEEDEDAEPEAEAASDTEAATTEEDSAPPLDPTDAEVAEAVATIAEDIREHQAEIAQAEVPAEDASKQTETAKAEPAPVDAKARERKLREYFRELLDQLMSEYTKGDRGLEIREVAGGFRLSTKPEYHDAVRGFVKSLKPPLKLSLQALEALAVVAYKQPVTAPEVSEIRGVESGGVLGSLLTRKLITTAGRKQVIGRPILYKTTKDFLVRFGLKDINELPSIEEFEKMAGEFADTDPVQEEMDMPNNGVEGMEEPNNSSEEATTSGDSLPVDEINSAPEPTTTLHDSVEGVMSDKSSSPEGSNVEDVERMKSEHEPQADGDDRPIADTDDIVVDGRLSGVPPRNTAEDNPSAEEAEIQSSEDGEAKS